MKHALAVCWFVCFALSTVLAGPRDAQWKLVDEALRQGLPKTAIARLEAIIEGALRDKAYPEAIKALVKKFACEGLIEGNKPEEKIARLAAALADAPAPMRPVLQAILAHWHWQYFQQNRGRFMQRTQTAEPPGDDIQTWDLARILTEIDKHFTAALADAAELQAIPIADFDALLVKGSLPDRYRPTLYDFLAREALEFYQAGEQGALLAEDAFALDAESPIFDDVAAFLKWRPATTDTRSPTLKAIALHQRLLAFHADAENRAAVADADLARLRFGYNQATGETKTARYDAALERFIRGWADHELAAQALAQRAELKHAAQDFVAARALAQRGLKLFPKSRGGAMCFNIIQQIEAKSASIATERVWNRCGAAGPAQKDKQDACPTITVTYRNVTEAHFRAVPYDFEELLRGRRWSWRQLDEPARNELLARQPVRAWSAALPATDDFQERVEEVPCPADLPPGFYYIVASHDRQFNAERHNQLSYAPVWVGDLALVTRQRNDASRLEGFVLDANSGAPIAGARARMWTRDYEGWFKPGAEAVTDENGLFQFRLADNRSGIIVVASGASRVSTFDEFWVGRAQRDVAHTRTMFFTDRALYRPGQTIYYKGICLAADQAQNDYRALAGQRVTVVFRDPNGKEIARAEHQANDFGSFDGAFTAPRDRLMGAMHLLADPNGMATVRVEEYKRPKFQVALKPPAAAPKLGEPTTLSGQATAYTGAPIGGATVKWRVERRVQFPIWCWWASWFWPHAGQGQAIAHGRALTDNEGKFTVEFVARPDPELSAKEEPLFEFQVFADVTDTTGETRSAAQTTRAGFTALQATVTTADWQTPAKPVEWSVGTRSLDGEPQAAQGVLKVFALKQPDRVARARLQPQWRPWRGLALREPPADPANPDSWDAGELVGELAVATDATGQAVAALPLPAGIYRAVLETTDRFGKPVTARLTTQVVDPAARKFGVRVASHCAAPSWSVEPGGNFLALWGTGYEAGRAFVELEHRGQTLRQYWTDADRTQDVLELAVGEELRGGFVWRVTHVRENRAYLNERIVQVPWSNKELTVKWERFTSKLLPGQQETWTAVVTGPGAERAAAEVVAALYDAALDQYQPHDWPRGFGVFRQEQSFTQSQFANALLGFDYLRHGWSVASRAVDATYRRFADEIVGQHGVSYRHRSGLRKSRGDIRAMAMTEAEGDAVAMSAMPPAPALAGGMAADRARGEEAGAAPEPPAPDLSQVAARQNLNETAFFFPRLLTDAAGVARLEFTMPEALTEWKFLAFAHDAALRSGFLTDKAVTAKDLMVEPNPPRFVREGDEIEFTVKVTNQTDAPQTGRARLTFADARTLEARDAALGNTAPERAFTVPGQESRTIAWRVRIPDGSGFLTYKAVGATATLSDGEEGYLPVLSRRILVTESLPLPIRGKQTKEFQFAKLLAAGESDTLRHQLLSVQMTSQPAWYAVMALPYLMEFPHPCSEQIFNRLYANALARQIANSDPKIRRIFDQWRNTPALDSPLEKNQDLKAVMLEETPWLRQAKSESEARRNVGILFDGNRLDEEAARALRQLAEQQLNEGLWPWFPGGRPSEYITLYITTGFGRLRHLGVKLDMASALKSLAALDRWVDAQYREILRRGHKDANNLSHTIALYLYGRSFFLKDRPIDDAAVEAVAYFREQARQHWLALGSRQSQGHVAIGLRRLGEQETPAAIMKSLKERSVSHEELGMFWRDLEFSWWWHRAPIETQALMIEAFAEVTEDLQAVEDCQVWLLKQKQTQDWKTTKATADAVYALLLRGANKLASDALVEVALAGEWLKPVNVEAGTGFYEQRFAGPEIKPEFGKITVKKADDGVSWGAVHWQYLEDMAKVTPHADTPLRLKKTLWIKETTKAGPVLKPVAGPVRVGDELVVRVELRTDRDMEYVHLKDQRGSGTEPVNVLSRQRFQDGLAYYESTRDTASHFFIEYLPKGVYVFEYSIRIQHKGAYQTGIAAIQCMYAPEFNSHSESFRLVVE